MIPRPDHRLAQRIRASGVRGADKLGERRPGGGRDPWRALYRRASGVFVIAAIAPVTQAGSRGFTGPWRSPRSG